MTTNKPPIRCTPCRVTYAGTRYQIESNGQVQEYSHELLGKVGDVLPESRAKLVRREAARQRRNRNARERHQAMRDVGMTKTRYGWE